MGRGFTLIDADTSKSLLLSRIIECFPAEFRLWPEVQDKSHLKLSGFEIIEKLGFVFDDDGLGSLDFYNDGILNENISKVFTDNRVVIVNLNRMLGNNV